MSAQIPKPMLAGRPGSLDDVRYPVIASPKLDGIRCLMVNGSALTRKFKPVPNNFVRGWLEANVPDGFDGELMVRTAGKDGSFQSVTSGIMSEDGFPDFFFAVFDYVKTGLDVPFSQRIQDLTNAVAKIKDPQHRIWVVPQLTVNDEATLLEVEKSVLGDGYEGLVVRSPSGPYKAGRSTVSEGYMLKIKRFEDSEAEVLAVLQMMHNDNEAETDAFGRTKRSLAQDGMVPVNTAGALSVRDVHTGVEFEIGTGMNDAQRKEIWTDRKGTVGRIIKYKFQPVGVKEKPRFPVFLGFRSAGDMD